MPTAVERLTTLLQDVLSLNAIDSPGAQDAFNTLDSHIDAGAAALRAATTPGALDAAERQYGGVFRTLGAGAFGLGGDLATDAVVFYVVDQFLGGGPVRGATGAQADFLTLDRQLFSTGEDLGGLGADLFRLGSLRSSSQLPAVQKSLTADASTLSSAFGALAGDTATLIADFGGGGANGGPAPAAVTTTPSPYAGLASALTPLVADFGAISSDFSHLSGLFGGGAGGPILAASATSSGGGSALTYNGVFASLDADFLTLSADLKGLGSPLANLLIPGSPTTTAAA